MKYLLSALFGIIFYIIYNKKKDKDTLKKLHLK